MTQHAHTASQGHRYQYGTLEVLAMQSGHVVIVRPINPAEPYPLGAPITVKASWLQPLAMRYFHGEVPA